MHPKPAHLGPAYGAQFADPSVVAAYHLRPPYPAEVFDVLVGLIRDEPGAVLDVGCGTGELARHLVDRVDRVDALDPSAGMLTKGRSRPGGDASNLTWIHGSAEDAPLRSPYALIVAGAGLHWTAWDVVLPRLRDALMPRGVLAIVEVGEEPSPWDNLLLALIGRFSTNRDYRPYDLIDELQQRDLFRPIGRHVCAAVPFEQPLADYVESFHARNGLSRDRMDPAAAAAFDQELTALVEPYVAHGLVHRGNVASIAWGDLSPRT